MSSDELDYKKLKEIEQEKRDARSFWETVRYSKSSEGDRRWLYFGHDNNQKTICLEFYPEWAKYKESPASNPRELFFNIGICDDWESTLSLSFGIPFLFKAFIVLDTKPGSWIKKLVGEYGDTRTGFTISSEAVHVDLLSDSRGYSKKRGWGKLWFVEDILKGRSKTNSFVSYSTTAKIVVPAYGDYPEKEYQAKVEKHDYTTKYSRFKTKHWDRWEVSVEGGVPVPGKGTCSWNCGESETSSISFGHGQVNSVKEALEEFVKSIQQTRREYPL